MYANIHISWYMLNRAVMGIFRSKIEVKSLCRGNFLFVPFNPLFYVRTMRQCFKNIPAKFQSRPTFRAGIFFQKSDGRRRSKEDFLPRFARWGELLNSPCCYQWSTVVACPLAFAAVLCQSARSASSAKTSALLREPVVIELRTVVPDHVAI